MVKAGILKFVLSFRLVCFVDDATIKQVDLSIGMTRVARIVRDHAYRRALLVQLAQKLHHCFAVCRIEISGWLIRKQNQRITGHCSRNRDALLLTARKLRRKMFGPMCHADAFERVHDSLLAIGGFGAAIGQGQFDVLVNVQVTDQVEALKYKPDFSNPRIDSSVDLPQPEGPAIEMYSPFLISI